MTQATPALGHEPIVDKFIEECVRGDVPLDDFPTRLRDLADQAGLAYDKFIEHVRQAIQRGDLSDHMVLAMPRWLGPVLGLQPMVAMS